MEIRTDIFQEEQANNNYKMVSSALFLMAARNTNEYSKPYLVLKIKFDYEIDHKGCMLRYELGKLNSRPKKKTIEYNFIQESSYRTRDFRTS